MARLIGGGLTTPIYIVNHPASHDTHKAQVNTNLVTGWQFNNLSILSKAITAFHDDVQKMGKADKVTGMTFSEFGRRIKSNASVGTDHGTAAPVLFFGAAVQPGIIGRLAKPCRKRHGQQPGSHAARFPAIVCCGDAGLAVLNSSGIANRFREFLYQAAGFWKRCIAT